MIYGNDWQKARAKTREVLDALRRKKPDATLVNLSEVGADAGRLTELCGSQGLFERKFIVFADGVCADDKFASVVSLKISDIASSENVFIFLEREVKAELLKIFSKYAGKVQKFEKLEKKEDFNSFILADALIERRGRELWLLFRQALKRGLSPEEIHGTLFWQAKTMRIVAFTDSPVEAGLKPFVWTKAKRALKFWKAEEIRQLSGKLLSVYHDSRRGVSELEIALEKFILEI